MLIIATKIAFLVPQEAIDRLEKLKQKDNQFEQLQAENARLREFEANFEDVQVCVCVQPLAFDIDGPPPSHLLLPFCCVFYAFYFHSCFL